MPQLLIATNNPGKVAELRTLLDGCGWEIVTPRELGIELSTVRTHQYRAFRRLGIRTIRELIRGAGL